MAIASEGLLVDTEQLSILGEKFTTTELGEQLTYLENKMSTIQNSWLDAEGTHFSQTFSSFIRDAQKITEEIKSLGDFASKMSLKYEEILTSKLSELEKC